MSTCGDWGQATSRKSSRSAAGEIDKRYVRRGSSPPSLKRSRTSKRYVPSSGAWKRNAGSRWAALNSRMPVTFSGTQKLTPAGDGSAIATGADVTVNVPMMGAILEPKVAAAVDGLFQKEAGILQEYLAKNA